VRLLAAGGYLGVSATVWSVVVQDEGGLDCLGASTGGMNHVEYCYSLLGILLFVVEYQGRLAPVSCCSALDRLACNSLQVNISGMAIARMCGPLACVGLLPCTADACTV
jgi:hypothetical protein